MTDLEANSEAVLAEARTRWPPPVEPARPWEEKVAPTFCFRQKDGHFAKWVVRWTGQDMEVNLDGWTGVDIWAHRARPDVSQPAEVTLSVGPLYVMLSKTAVARTLAEYRKPPESPSGRIFARSGNVAFTMKHGPALDALMVALQEAANAAFGNLEATGQ